MSQPAPASAGSLEDARARLAELEQQISQQQASLDATHVRLDALGARIAALEAAPLVQER